jgi:O-antigen/teichoic acid export membrane protein
MLGKSIWNTIVQTFGKIIMILISLVTTALLTKRLGANIYGGFVLTTSVFLLLDALADFGSRAIGVREASKNPEKANEIYRELTGLRLMMANIGFVIGVIVIFSFKGFADIKIEALISLLMIFFTSIAGSLEIIYQTKMKLDLKTIMDISFPLIFLILLLGYRLKLSLILVMIMYLVARVISLLIGQKIIKWKIQIKINRIWYWLKELWPMGVYLIVFTAYDRAVDSMMISRYLTMKDVAYYGLSYKIYNSLVQPAYFFVASVFPLLSSQIEKKRKLFFGSLALILGVLIIGAPILSMLAPFMINVLGGSEFLPSVGVLRILIFAMIFAYINHLFGFTLIAKRGQKSILLIGLIALTFNIIGNMYAIPRFGITGAALVTVYTEMLSAVMLGLSLLLISRRK